MTYLIAYIAAALVFFGLDMIWLTRLASGFYQSQIGPLLKPQPDLAAAGAFYLVYIGGIVFFAVAPAVAGGGLIRAVLAGAFLGLIAYGTYDATNLATMKGFSATVAIVDVLWGVTLTSVSAAAGYFAASRFGG